MQPSGSRYGLALLVTLASTLSLSAQQPSPQQVQAFLQQPGAAAAVRERISGSGLTPEQIRTRLRENGYPQSLLDAFLDNTLANDPNDTLAVTPSHLAAMRALGLAMAPSVPESVDSVLHDLQPTTSSRIFGVDVFRRTTTQFRPLLAGPVPQDYQLGPGDILVLILTGDVELTLQLAVSREGFVLIPQAGQVYLANLTLEQARGVVTDRLSRVYSGVHRGDGATTLVDLSVVSVRAVQVYVVGEVNRPGAYQISALGTILTALYAAGGITELANPRAVAVRRGRRTATTFDLYQYLLAGNTGSDIRVENGDVIFVDVRTRRVEVNGSVLRPALYDLLPPETLTDLIAAAGGLLADATRTRLAIERVVPAVQRTLIGPQRVTLDVPLPAASAEIPPVPLEDGDVITVFSIPDAERNSVTIQGNVYLPGRFGLEPEMTLSLLVARAGGLKPATYDVRAHISRVNRTDQTRRIMAVALPPDSTSLWLEDPLLEDRDSVVIYSRLEMRADRMVSITGAVNDPITVPWRDGITLRDLVLEARGLAPGAWLDSAEIARLPENRGNGELATTLRVPLDSTYLFDRDSLGRPLGPPGPAFRGSGTPEVPLAPWDNVLIFQQPGFEYQRIVSLLGEVRFPGMYSLRTKHDRLSDLIARAGGVTGGGYLQGARFLRVAGDVGRLDVDLSAALRNPGSAADIVLQPGDEIDVPEFQPSVRIEGAVNSPGSVLWERGKKLDYYISAAGGVTLTGDQSHASVRHANGHIETRRGGFLFFGGHTPSPQPGSAVFVPLKEERPARDNSTIVAALASMIASTATILVALLR